MTTNRFTIGSGLTINLGFVDTLSGVAIPANNPLNLGATGGDIIHSYPAALAGAASIQANLTGAWYSFDVAVNQFTGDVQGWDYCQMSFDSNGAVSGGQAWDSTPETYSPAWGHPTFFVDPSGTVGDGYTVGAFNRAKDVWPFTVTFAPDRGPTKTGGVAGAALGLFVKQTSFAASDLTGSWSGHAFVVGGSGGWIHSDFTFNTAGVATYTALLTSTGAATLPSDETYSVSSGFFVSNTLPSYQGALNSGKNILVGTGNISPPGCQDRPSESQ